MAAKSIPLMTSICHWRHQKYVLFSIKTQHVMRAEEGFEKDVSSHKSKLQIASQTFEVNFHH